MEIRLRPGSPLWSIADDLSEKVFAAVQATFPKAASGLMAAEQERVRVALRPLLACGMELQQRPPRATSAARTTSASSAPTKKAATKKKKPVRPPIVWTGQTRKSGSHRGGW